MSYAESSGSNRNHYDVHFITKSLEKTCTYFQLALIQKTSSLKRKSSQFSQAMVV